MQDMLDETIEKMFFKRSTQVRSSNVMEIIILLSLFIKKKSEL